MQALQLQAPALLKDQLACVTGPANTSISLQASTLEPGEVVTCAKRHTITTADIEAGTQDLVAVVRGSATTGPVASQEKTQTLTPIIKPDILVEVLVDQCNKPAHAGTGLGT